MAWVFWAAKAVLAWILEQWSQGGQPSAEQWGVAQKSRVLVPFVGLSSDVDLHLVELGALAL